MGLNDDIFPTYQSKQSVPEERPNHKIVVELSLERNIKQDRFRHLNTDLQRNNMNVSEGRNDTIIVQGIPPGNDFNEQNVLKIVQEYYPDAQIISSRELRM